MTKQSFDEMMDMLDEVVMEGSADQIDIDSDDEGAVYSPADDIFQQDEPALVPSSPPGVGIQPILLSSPSGSNSVSSTDGGRIHGQGAAECASGSCNTITSTDACTKKKADRAMVTAVCE